MHAITIEIQKELKLYLMDEPNAYVTFLSTMLEKNNKMMDLFSKNW